MIVTQQELTEILAGELTELRLEGDQAPRVGATPLVQSKVGRKAPCCIRILDRWRHRDGGWVILFEKAPRQDPGRFLKARGGYVTNHRHAMRDSASSRHQSGLGAPPELQAVDPDVQDRFSQEARMLGHQANAARQLEHESRSVIDRLESVILEHEALGLNAWREMARLEAAIAKLERQSALARRQRRAA